MRLRRRQAVRRIDPRLGGQVLEVDPYGRPRRGDHRFHVGAGEPAAEAFDDDARKARAVRTVAAAHTHAGDRLVRAIDVERRRDARQARERIDPERDGEAVFGHELAGETPADACVTVVVDDLAEDVPALRGHASTPEGGSAI